MRKTPSVWMLILASIACEGWLLTNHVEAQCQAQPVNSTKNRGAQCHSPMTLNKMFLLADGTVTSNSSSSSTIQSSSSTSSTTGPTSAGADGVQIPVNGAASAGSVRSSNGTTLETPTGAVDSNSVRTYKPTLIFVPKFKERLLNLADQIRLVQSKGFISSDEASLFLDRQSKLLLQEAEASKKGFPRPELDDLEKAITLLNSDLFKASKKSDPVKPGPAQTEVNDPNLIPAYPDPELQPGSGKIP